MRISSKCYNPNCALGNRSWVVIWIKITSLLVCKTLLLHILCSSFIIFCTDGIGRHIYVLISFCYIPSISIVALQRKKCKFTMTRHSKLAFDFLKPTISLFIPIIILEGKNLQRHYYNTWATWLIHYSIIK